MEASQSLSLNILRARQLFFEEKIYPRDLVGNTILQSWINCAGYNRHPHEQVDFEIKRDKHDRVEFNRGLIVDFELALASFPGVLKKSGFFPVLTDASATTIARFCDINEASGSLYRALQIGSDMSEQAIGTAAMNCALLSGESVQVLGAEHYFADNAGFSCAAAPIYAPMGKIAGVINLTKHQKSREFGALNFVESCANAIERMQLERLPAQMLLRVFWSMNGESRNASVAFGEQGELIGMTRQASRILNPCGRAMNLLRFEDIFDGSFSDYVDQLTKSKRPLLAQLSSGLFVFLEMLKGPRSGGPVRKGQRLATDMAIAPGEEILEMGDPNFKDQFTPALKALSFGLGVMVSGETGTGKEVTARALHVASRPEGEFIAVNCAALPETLIESELFGYVEGAFTNSRKGGATGRIEEASGGTLFLDEIGDMPLTMQARLLRVLDRREVIRVGSGKSIPVDFQLICATHQDLVSMVNAGRFRSDLYYRIVGLELRIPPLRERRALAGFFEMLVTRKCAYPAGIEVQATQRMLAYHWPGNTRQAISVIKRAIIAADGASPLSVKNIEDALRALRGSEALMNEQSDKASASVDAVRDKAIADALRASLGNISHAAQILGISRSTLQRRLRIRPHLMP